MALNFSNNIPLIKFGNYEYASSSVSYDGGKPSLVFQDENSVTQAHTFGDFKLHIGREKARNTSRDIGGANKERTNLGIAKDFFELLLENLRNGLISQGKSFPDKILIAEPLPLPGADKVDKDWLRIYRDSIKKILPQSEGGKLPPFKEISFLPEPFAVYQYYRYGSQHQALAQSKKNIVFVADFGGGTFDCCVVETTYQGDISRAGKNANAYGAHSIPVGGFYINKIITEKILSLFHIKSKQDRKEIESSLRHYEHFRNDPDHISYDDYSEKRIAFFKNFEMLLISVETAKISIVRQINSWGLDDEITPLPKSSVSVPIDIFSSSSEVQKFSLDANLLREIFLEEIWEKKLKNAVSVSLNRAKADLNGKKINLVLLSGGSSNFRWIKPLLERDFFEPFEQANILELDGKFQEIVAKGLAIECARRYFNPGQGDFASTTYNTLCLSLSANGGPKEIKNYKMIEPERRKVDELGVLLHSSHDLRGVLGKTYRWSIQLGDTPKQSLGYYFMRSTLDHDLLENRLNFVEDTVYPKPKSKFGNSIEVELTFSEDMTIHPRFVFYSNKQTGEESSVEAAPFCLDSTFVVDQEVGGQSFLGFDFGTSTTALSLIDQSGIEIYKERSADQEWLQIDELINVLPYLASNPLRQYAASPISDTNHELSRNVIESFLELIYAVLFSEHLCTTKRQTRFFKELKKCSAGPLWGGIKKLSEAVGNKAHFSKCLVDFVSDPENQKLMDDLIDAIGGSKHRNKSVFNYTSAITKLGNLVNSLFTQFKFGFFEVCHPSEFEEGVYQGIFRLAYGYSPPFPQHLIYEGTQSFISSQVFLADVEGKRLLKLSPFLLNSLSSLALGNGSEMHVYQKFDDGSFFFRGVQEDQFIRLNDNPKITSLVSTLEKFSEFDQTYQSITDVELGMYEKEL